MMVLLIAASSSSLIGIGSVIYKPPNVKAQLQQQLQKQQEQLQKLTPNTSQLLKQQPQVTGTLIGRISSFINYASSDGKACLAYATISTRLYHPNYPLGLKPGDTIGLVVPDQSMCVLLGQAKIANIDIQFRVALPPVTSKEMPLYIQQNFPPNQPQYRIVYVVLS